MEDDRDDSGHLRPGGAGDEALWRRRARRSNLAFIAFVVALTLWQLLAMWHEPWTWLRGIGLAVFIVSEVLVVVARLQLGLSFTTGAEARRLVTRGLYSRIQNPIYLFAMTAVAGLIVVLNKPWYFLCFLAVVPFQMARVRRERKALLEKFGEEYLLYRKRTWF